MAPFKPHGERARWRLVYDLLCEAQINDVVTYENLGGVLGLKPGSERHEIQMATRRAAKEFLEVKHRAIEVQPNVGYRIVEPKEHLRLARGHNSKAGRALVRGHSTATNVDLTGMDMEMRRAFEAVALVMSKQMEFNRRIEYRQNRLAAALDSVSTRQELTEERVEELATLQERLKLLEEKMGIKGD